MSEHREEFLDLCAAYALGSLDAPDRARLESHLESGCDDCETALADFTQATLLLANAAPPVQPPAALRERVLQAARAAKPAQAGSVATRRDAGTERTAAAQQVTTPRPSGPTRGETAPFPAPVLDRGTGGWSWSWGWIAAAACLALAIWGWTDVARLRGNLAAQLQRVAQLEQDRTHLEEQLADEQRWVGVMSAAGARVAELQPTPAGQASLRGRAIVDPASHRAVVVLDNLHPPSDRDYQLWAIRGGKPASLGLVHVDARGQALLRLDDVGDPATLNAVAVSLEPKGGAPTPTAPTGPVVLVGTFSG